MSQHHLNELSVFYDFERISFANIERLLTETPIRPFALP